MGLFNALFGWLRRSDNGPDIAGEPVAGAESDGQNYAMADRVPVILTGMTSEEGVRASKVIARLLSNVSILSVRRASRRIEVEYGSSRAVMSAIEQSQDALETDHAQVAICGAATGDGAAVGFWFVVRDDGAETVPGRFTSDDILIAPSDFPTEVQNTIAASVVAAACGASPVNAHRLAPVLKHYSEILDPLIDDELAALQGSMAAGMLNAIGNVLATYARFARHEASYERAAQAYERAARGFDPAFSPLSWAGTRSHHVKVLQALAALRSAGDGDDGETLLTQAAAILSEIGETLSMESAPRAWAQAQIDFAMMTYRDAMRKGTQKPFRDALKALQSAQSVFSRQAMPVKWSEIMNNMGVILLTMGEERGDDGVLKHAIASFEQAIQVRRRETMPKLWAQTANNLGAASFAFAKRTRDKAAMTGAARNFEGAKEVYEELGQTKRALIIEKNLSRVRRLIETTGD